MDYVLQYLPNLMLIFCRITSFFVVAPIFSAKNVPIQFKVGFSFLVAMITLSTLTTGPMAFDSQYILEILKEITIGLLLGFVAYMFFTVVQVAGSFIDMQMGFSIANIIDPMTGAQSPVIGNLKFVMAVLLFLVFNGHHLLIQAIIESYNWVPLSNAKLAALYNGQISEFLFKTFTTTFSLAFQMAAPMIAALFLIDIGLGILARTAPQFNIFVIGLPLKVFVGFLLLTLLFPGFLYLFNDLFSSMFKSIQKLLEILSVS